MSKNLSPSPKEGSDCPMSPTRSLVSSLCNLCYNTFIYMYIYLDTQTLSFSEACEFSFLLYKKDLGKLLMVNNNNNIHNNEEMMPLRKRADFLFSSDWQNERMNWKVCFPLPIFFALFEFLAFALSKQ